MPHPKGGYRLSDGSKVPGTTTICGRFKESGALLYWAFEQGKAAERGEISNLYDKRDEAATAGTLAHDMVYAHITNKAFEVPKVPDEVARQAENAYNSYLTWEKNTKINIVAQEIELVSEDHLFGGCPDAIGEIDGLYYLIDWKTAKSVYSDNLLQLAAYKHLIEKGLKTSDYQPITINDKPIEISGHHLCRFAKEHGDFAHHFWPELNEAWELFLLYRQAYDLDKIVKKRVG